MDVFTIFLGLSIFAFLIFGYSFFFKEKHGLEFVFSITMAVTAIMFFNESQIEKRNKVSCTSLGIVMDVSCAGTKTKSICRVLLNSGDRLNLTPNIVAIKGDKVSYCTNSEPALDYKNYHKIDS